MGAEYNRRDFATTFDPIFPNTHNETATYTIAGTICVLIGGVSIFVIATYGGTFDRYLVPDINSFPDLNY